MAKHGLTDEQLQSLRQAFRSTWDTIAHDILSECGGTLDRDSVVEVVLDADHLEMYGPPPTVGRLEEKKIFVKETIAQFRKLTIEQQDEIAYDYFQFKTYGM